MAVDGPADRDRVLAVVCERILAVRRPHRLRLALDGVDPPLPPWRAAYSSPSQ